MAVQNPAKKEKLAGYQKFFEGYTDVRFPRKNGKGFKIRRIYTAEWQLMELSDSGWILRKLLFAALALYSAAILIIAALGNISGNRAATVALPMGFSAAALLFEIFNVGYYVTRSRRMTLYDRKNSHTAVLRWSAISAVCQALTALMLLVYMVTNGFAEALKSCVCALEYLTGAAASFAMYYLEMHTDYYEEENETEIPFFPDEEF